MNQLLLLLAVTGGSLSWNTNRWPHVSASVLRTGGIVVKSRRSLAESWKTETSAVSADEAAAKVMELLTEAGYNLGDLRLVNVAGVALLTE